MAATDRVGGVKKWAQGQSWFQLAEHAVVLGGTVYVARQILKEGVASWATRHAMDLLAYVPGVSSIIEAEKAAIVQQIEDHVLGELGYVIKRRRRGYLCQLISYSSYQ